MRHALIFHEISPTTFLSYLFTASVRKGLGPIEQRRMSSSSGRTYAVSEPSKMMHLSPI